MYVYLWLCSLRLGAPNLLTDACCSQYSPRIAANPYIVGSFACIGGGLFGLDISSMSGVLSNPSYLRVFEHPGSNAQGAIVASMPAGK